MERDVAITVAEVAITVAGQGWTSTTVAVTVTVTVATVAASEVIDWETVGQRMDATRDTFAWSA